MVAVEVAEEVEEAVVEDLEEEADFDAHPAVYDLFACKYFH